MEQNKVARFLWLIVYVNIMKQSLQWHKRIQTTAISVNSLTGRFSAKIGMPILQPCHQLLGIAFVTLLADNLSNVRRLVLVNPQQ